MKRRNPFTRRVSLLLGVMTIFPWLCAGHSLYFEPSPAGNLILRFGEFGEEPEESPGHLDSLDPVSCWSPGDSNPARAPKQSQGFTTRLNPSSSALSESGFAIMTRGGTPPRKPYFYARWISDWQKPETPQLILDMAPTGVPGELIVSFRNKPVAEATAILHTPNGQEIEIQSDAKGLLKFHIPQDPGIYMLKVGRFREELAGFQNGVPYELSSHNCSVTWNQP